MKSVPTTKLGGTNGASGSLTNESRAWAEGYLFANVNFYLAKFAEGTGISELDLARGLAESLATDSGGEIFWPEDSLPEVRGTRAERAAVQQSQVAVADRTHGPGTLKKWGKWQSIFQTFLDKPDGWTGYNSFIKAVAKSSNVTQQAVYAAIHAAKLKGWLKVKNDTVYPLPALAQSKATKHSARPRQKKLRGWSKEQREAAAARMREANAKRKAEKLQQVSESTQYTADNLDLAHQVTEQPEKRSNTGYKEYSADNLELGV